MKQFFSVAPLIPPEFKQKLEIDRGEARDLSLFLSLGYEVKIIHDDVIVSPRQIDAGFVSLRIAAIG